ncbi:MAG TPA: NTP transferase domain-containing protein [Limnochordia bacterium]|nr:NTP transferase domain-containing protein [Limnochordia bacterium]
MQPIIIGAGRGSRLKAMTDDQPKCYVEIAGRRILDWVLAAFRGAGLPEAVFIGGYQIERIKGDYPQLTFAHNRDWPHNNILASLFHAEPYMSDGFVASYADILFRPGLVAKTLAHPGDIVLGVDTRWRERYADRSQHPEADAEKVTAEGDHLTCIGRDIPSERADGEFIGVAKFTAAGAERFRSHYHRIRAAYAGRPWRSAAVFEKAYLILLFQEMLECGEPLHLVTTQGEYMEIDTEEDYALAQAQWVLRADLRVERSS